MKGVSLSARPKIRLGLCGEGRRHAIPASQPQTVYRAGGLARLSQPSKAVHATPSGEVRITPSPTATNSDPFQARLCRSRVVGDFRCVHVIPSGEVNRAPFKPAVMNVEPFHNTAV